MVRKAKLKDIKSIHGLLQFYGYKGELLPRPLSELYDHLRDFSVFEDTNENKILGCCALQICWDELAEVRSLAVEKQNWNKDIGTHLVESIIEEAKSYNISKVFTLTYKPDFFKRFGFKIVDRKELPLKIWGGCFFCVKFPDCDEIAMMKDIRF
ncbi:MAG: N-acetyltransferase [Desulfobacterales bacterium]|nr:N-acetyltransferase [Desulfobacterales bacterium]